MNYRGSTIFVVSQLLVGLDQCELQTAAIANNQNTSRHRGLIVG